MKQPHYHLQLIVKHKTGEVTYNTFPENDWTMAFDYFIQEITDPVVAEARLILHLRGSYSNDDHISVEEYP